MLEERLSKIREPVHESLTILKGYFDASAIDTKREYVMLSFEDMDLVYSMQKYLENPEMYIETQLDAHKKFNSAFKINDYLRCGIIRMETTWVNEMIKSHAKRRTPADDMFMEMTEFEMYDLAKELRAYWTISQLVGFGTDVFKKIREQNPENLKIGELEKSAVQLASLYEDLVSAIRANLDAKREYLGMLQRL